MRKIEIVNMHRDYRNYRRSKDWVRLWLFSDTAFERLNPEE